MSRFPSPTLADRIDDRVQELGDGFVRLGGEDTPFTLREGGESLENARRLHSERDESERERDEESNEPLTRTLPEWREDMIGLDFPFVDTIPLDEQRRRANQVAELATTENVVERIDREVEFQDETVRGKYWRGIQLIEIGTESDDFPGFQAGVVLAHELGHAFYDAWSPDSGIEEQPRLFRTTPRTDDRDGWSLCRLPEGKRRRTRCRSVRISNHRADGRPTNCSGCRPSVRRCLR
jgi:hypothetical protein